MREKSYESSIAFANEHRIPPDWTAHQILDYRNKYASLSSKELKEAVNIKKQKSTLPKK